MEAAASLLRPQARAALPLGRSFRPLHLVLVTLALALTVRAVGLGTRPLWLDEAYSAWFSARGWHELWAIVPTYETHPPFYYSLLKIWRQLFGGDPIALRSFSVLLGVLTVPVMIAAVYEQERQEATGRALLRAWVVAFLAACSPMLVFIDQEARPYPLMVFAYAVAILGLLRLMREFSADGAGTWRSWLFLACGTELILWAHGLGILYAGCLFAALAGAMMTAPASHQRLARATAVTASVALLYLPCLLIILNRTADWGTGWLSWQWFMLLQLLGLYSVPVEALTAGSAVAALAMLLLIKRAVQSAFAARGWNSERAIMLLWWGPPVIAMLISALFLPVFLPRTLAATLVPAYLAIGAALARTNSPRERLGLAAALCIPLIVSAVQIGTRPPTEQWDEVSAYLGRHVSPSDQVWLYPNDSALPLREANPKPNYRARGIPADYPAVGVKGPIRAGSPAVVSLTAQQAERVATDPAIRNVPTIWLVTRQTLLFDPDRDVPRLLASVRNPGKLEQWGYITVQPFTARRAASRR